VYRQIAPSLALVEASEAMFRPLRRIAIYASKRGDDSVRSILMRLLLYTAVRRWRKGLHARRIMPVAEEPCARCATGLANRTVLEPSLLGNLAPFVRMMEVLGFDARKCFTRLQNSTIVVHDAHVDPIPAAPTLPSLTEISQQRAQALRAEVQQHFHPAAAAHAGHQAPAAHAAPALATAAPADERDEKTPLSMDDALDDVEFEQVFGSEAEQDYWDDREIADAESAEAREDSDFKMPAASATNLAQTPPAETECGRARLRSHRASACPICGGVKQHDDAGPAAAAGSGAGMQLG
jgi:hypothetical protein